MRFPIQSLLLLSQCLSLNLLLGWVSKPPVIFLSPNSNPVQPCLAFYMGSAGVTSGPYVCKESALTCWDISLVQIGVLCSTDDEKD